MSFEIPSIAGLPSDVVAAILQLLAAAAVGVAVYAFLYLAVRRVAGRTMTGVDDAAVRHGRWPLRFLLPALALYLALPAVRPDLPDAAVRWLDVSLGVVLPVLFGWLLVGVVRVFEDFALERLDLDARDNLEARKRFTQVRILKRIALVLIVVFTVGVILMSFDRLRQIGTGLLASAGLAGLIIGFSAQKVLGNLVAGIQIAITQPIRIDDVVIVEGEWGRVEEITLSYVVVRIWDLRRLVVPISYFLENPFQNWTRTSADLLGTVFLYLDYRVPVEELRSELHRVLRETELWDGEVWGLQVTDTDERTMTVRALMSAPDSGTAWNLRCLVRERLIDWLQREHPESLPRVRSEVAAELRGRLGDDLREEVRRAPAPGDGPEEGGGSAG